MGALVKFSLAAVCAVLGIYLSVCAWSGKWPAMVSVRNEIENVDCALTFDDEWTWNVALGAGEEKRWLFLLGTPYEVTATCRAATRTIAFSIALCPTDNNDRTVVISEPQASGPARQNPLEEGADLPVGGFCLVS